MRHSVSIVHIRHKRPESIARHAAVKLFHGTVEGICFDCPWTAVFCSKIKNACGPQETGACQSGLTDGGDRVCWGSCIKCGDW